MVIRSQIEIKTTLEKIEGWLRNLDRNYKKWHPDHRKWINLTGSLNEGDIFYFEEYICKRLYRAKCKITKIKRNKKTSIEFKIISSLNRIFIEKGTFIIETKGDSCMFIATLSFRFGWLILIFFKRGIEAIKKHMEEEGKNLKRLLEERD